MRSLSVAIMAVILLAGNVAPAVAAEPQIRDLGDDIVLPEGLEVPPYATQANDPLGLVPGMDLLRTHSLGPDRIDVWRCDLSSPSLASIVATLDAQVGAHFAHHSRGRITIDFIARGSASGGEGACLNAAANSPSANANGAMVIGPWSGGLGGPGNGGTSWPSNSRWSLVGNADLGGGSLMSTTAAHEYGHMQWWPHSFTTTGANEYDNAVDLMSGNYGTDGFSAGSWPDPYDTAVINRYAAGWIDAAQVRDINAAATSFRLEPSSGNGIQMGVIRAGSKYYTLGARTRSTYDPFPAAWQGVEVYEVTPCPSSNLNTCFQNDRFDFGFREVAPFGKVPFDYTDFDAYSEPLPHVISAGTNKSINGRTVSVTAASGGAYTVTVSGTAGSTFNDTSTSTYKADIDWLAAEGITKGCNPPANDRFCPNESVTRGQMAAFLHRALPDLPTGTPTEFIDDNTSTYEADIEWLSATGVTRGCNPPTNNRFCPTDVVTRAQMAAFLHRALPDLPLGAPVEFTDDNGSSYESDIEWLARAGITRGCNPPSNTRFCPNDPVTRGQMAAFLRRALEE